MSLHILFPPLSHTALKYSVNVPFSYSDMGLKGQILPIHLQPAITAWDTLGKHWV